jgi:hypothetical protein
VPEATAGTYQFVMRDGLRSSAARRSARGSAGNAAAVLQKKKKKKKRPSIQSKQRKNEKKKAAVPDLVGETVEIYWEAERGWFLGTVTEQRGSSVHVQYPSNRLDDHEIQLAATAATGRGGGWRWRRPSPEALPTGPGDVTLLLNDPLHACSGCAKAGAERVLALFFFRLAPQHRTTGNDALLPLPCAAHVAAELSARESRGMAASFRRGFSFEQSRELFSGTNWRNITNYFVAKRQRKHINAALVKPGERLMERVSPAVERSLREMSGDQLGLADFVLVEGFCNYYVSFHPHRVHALSHYTYRFSVLHSTSDGYYTNSFHMKQMQTAAHIIFRGLRA